VTAPLTEEGVGRPDGFYWVRWEDEGGDDWQPAEWDAKARRWWMIGLDVNVVDAMEEVGPRLSSPEREQQVNRLVEAARQAETVMMIVQPRSHKAEYLAALDAVRAALAAFPEPTDV